MENKEEMLQDTTPEAETSEEVKETDTTPSVEENETKADTTAEEQKTEEPFVVRFNHADKELSREEAISLAQKGLKLDSMAEMLNDLNYYSALRGKNSHEAIKDLIENAESEYKKGIVEKYGEDNDIVDMMMERFRADNKQKYEAFKEAEKAKEDAAKNTIEERVADEFIELQKEFPEIADLQKVPKDVLKDAYNGKNLMDSYLRYMHKESKKIASAKQTAQSNAEASAGKMAGEAEKTDSFMDAFLRGLQS